MSIALDREMMKEARAKTLALLSAGYTDEECADLMGLTFGDFSEVKKATIEWEGERLRSRSNEEVYVEYLLMQNSVVKDLTVLHKALLGEGEEGHKKKSTVKNASAIVGALKAKSDIYDKVVKMGQDLGFILKTPDRKEIAGGIVVAQMDDIDIRRAILRELRSMDSMIKTYGSGKLIEIDPGPVHRELPSPSSSSGPKPYKKGAIGQRKIHKGRIKRPK